MNIILARAIGLFAQVITLLLVGRALFSWFGQNPYSTPGKIYRFLIDITEPIVMPCRNLIARFNFNTGMLDFSVLLAFIFVEIIARVLIKLVLIIL